MTPPAETISPQVAQILSAARNNLTPIQGSNPVRTQSDATLPTLTTQNILSSFLSANQTPSGMLHFGLSPNVFHSPAFSVSSVNLLANLFLNPALQFNLPPPPPPTYSSVNQLLMNVLSSMPQPTSKSVSPFADLGTNI
jgi:hypothetical protein